MKVHVLALTVALVAVGCGEDPNANADGDCMTDVQEAELGTDAQLAGADADADGITDCEEIAMGTDPVQKDSDGDGFSDSDEVACKSNPLDAQHKCYACGWKRNNPGGLNSTGNSIGDVLDNLVMPDQCGDDVSVWDFHGEYHILYMTAAW